MVKKKANKNLLLILNSDENILKILEQSNEYLGANIEFAAKINENIRIFRSLVDLIPETLENFWSGHIFPITEAEYELESSIEFCKLGFYKHSIIALRNALELGLLSVYWDIDGQSHIDIQKWLRSGEPTPFRRIVFAKLKKYPNIQIFDDKHKIFDQTANLYELLSNFAHTKGVTYSSHDLGHSNINTFNEKSFRKWFMFMTEVIKVIVAFHILKYPVGLQHTPIDEKFGLNGPAGGFLEPAQAERIKNLFDKEVVGTLQEISDLDPEARSIAEWVNKKSDITEEEFRMQIESQDKRMIEMSGFQNWHRNEKKLLAFLKDKSPVEYEQKQEYLKKMREWAKEKGVLQPPQERKPPS